MEPSGERSSVRGPRTPALPTSLHTDGEHPDAGGSTEAQAWTSEGELVRNTEHSATTMASAFIPTVIGWLPVVMTAISGLVWNWRILRFSTAFEKDTTGTRRTVLALMERVFGLLLGMVGPSL